MQAAKLILNNLNDFRVKIKSEWLQTKISFARIGDADFRFLIKVSAILILLPLIISIFTEASLISTIAFWIFVVSGIILFFVWLGYLFKNIIFSVFGVTQKTYIFVSTPRLELSFHYLIFKIRDLYISWEYQISSYFDKPAMPKKGERLVSWFERIEPMQMYRVCRARFKNAQNMIDYYDAINLDRLIDSEREKRLKSYKHHQKQLVDAERGMKQAIERMENV